MAPGSLTLCALVASLVLAGGARAQDLRQTIVGCADVGCPKKPGTASTSADCKLAGKTFTVIGLARIPRTSEALKGLSWVEGVAVTDRGDGTRTFDKSFYLAAPPAGAGSQQIDTGCAVFFTKVSKKTAFDDPNISDAEGTCEEAMSRECVEALIARAKAIPATGGPGNGTVCEPLKAAFEESLDPACSEFATGSKWSGVQVKAIYGQGAPSPITAEQNSSSNCWPVIPKPYDLSLINSVIDNSDISIDTLQSGLFEITPILTVVYPDSSSPSISTTEAHLTCMKTLDQSVADSATKQSDDKNSGGGSTAPVGSRGLVAIFSVAAMIWFAV